MGRGHRTHIVRAALFFQQARQRPEQVINRTDGVGKYRIDDREHREGAPAARVVSNSLVLTVGLELDLKPHPARLTVVHQDAAGVAHFDDHPRAPHPSQAIDQLQRLPPISQFAHFFHLRKTRIEPGKQHPLQPDLGWLTASKLQRRFAPDARLLGPAPGLAHGQALVGGVPHLETKRSQGQHHAFGHGEPP